MQHLQLALAQQRLDQGPVDVARRQGRCVFIVRRQHLAERQLFAGLVVGRGVHVGPDHLLVERGRLSYDTPIAKVWPEFAARGKQGILVRHVLPNLASVILVQTSAAGSLRKAGLSEGTVGILPLFLFAAAILLKPRAVELIEARRKNKQDGRGNTNATSLDITLVVQKTRTVEFYVPPQAGGTN